MREIKYRAWNHIDKKMESVCGIVWSEGKVNDLNIGGDGLGVSYHDPIEDYELMQYSGIKDKNGKEIYEGDILKYSCGGTPQATQMVVSLPEFYQSFGEYIEGYYYCDNFEVIGNIWENQGLRGLK